MRATIEAPHSRVKLTSTAFDHPEWSRAHPIHITRKWSGDPSPASRHAEARIIWTDKSLIVRFVCRQEEPVTVSTNPQLGTKTPRLWDRDVCEIFLAPDAKTPERYFEFEASPAGEWLDIAITLTPSGRETNFDFQSGMTAAASLVADQTIVCMTIPWSSCIPKPQSGDRWRVNLFRCVGSGDERYLAWQPTFTVEPNFHVPEVFGELKFN